MKPICFFLITIFPAGTLSAQNDIPLLRPEERRVVDEQRSELYSAMTPVVTAAAKSTVNVRMGPKRVAYGTVVGNGREILTKWSELRDRKGALTVQPADGEPRPAVIRGVYAGDDLALLSLEGDPLVPVTWSFEEPGLGRFLAAPHPEGRLASFGVVSVGERNYRDTDKAYLGIKGKSGFAGPGVKIDSVEPDSGAAAAGLKSGDVILKVGDRVISGLLELQNALTGVEPGAALDVLADVAGERKNFTVTLGKRPKLEQFSGARLQQMERMGGEISRVRDSFTRVIQTDMPSKPNQIGGPVVDLQGRVVGITVARADRTRSFLMPASAVVKLLEEKADEPELASIPQEVENPADPSRNRPRIVPPPQKGEGHPSHQNGEDHLRRQIGEMRRLMDLMDDEIAGMDGGR